jgi:hypothetical protein
MKRQFKRSTRKTVLYVLIVLFIAGAVIFAFRFSKTVEKMLTCNNFVSTQDLIVNTVPLNGKLLVATSEGNLQCFDSEGKALWGKNIGGKIFNINVNSAKTEISVASVDFHLLDKDGKELFKKTLELYIPLRCQFLTNGNYKFLFQSLSDFSYVALTVDKTGKTLSTEKVPDFGESSFIDLSASGRILFTGERGEVYIYENGSVIKDNLIDKQVTSIHNVYGYFAGSSSIIVGYKTADDTSLKIPVNFYDENLQIIKSLQFDANVNGVNLDKEIIIFALDSGFKFYNSSGELIKEANDYGFSAISYFENGIYEVFVYLKKPEKENDKPLYKIVVKDMQGNEIGTYLNNYDYPPLISLSDVGKLVFISYQNKIECLYK